MDPLAHDPEMLTVFESAWSAPIGARRAASAWPCSSTGSTRSASSSATRPISPGSPPATPPRRRPNGSGLARKRRAAGRHAR